MSLSMGGGIIATLRVFAVFRYVRSYNMTMLFTRRASRLIVLLALGVAAVTAGADAPSPAKVEADLNAVREQMDNVRAELERDAGRRDKLSKELEESEKSVGSARDELDRLRRARAEQNAKRAELADER